MKRMVCEVCGGNDITKIDDTIFQCVSCGCKYTVEQARKLMQDILDSHEVINKARVEDLFKKALMEIDIQDFNRAQETL